MKVQLKHHKDDIYYDIYFGSKRYWRQMGERMFGYCMLSQTLVDHIIRPLESFEFLDKRVQVPEIRPQANQFIPSNPAADALECGS